MIYENRDNLQLYINKKINELKILNDISIYIDDLEYGDDFKIGLIYRIRDTKNNKLYIGSEKIARGKRQKRHIPNAKQKISKKEKLSKFQKHIYYCLNDLKRFIDEIYEIVIYKEIEKLYEREQYYIDLFDTIKNGLNDQRAKVIIDRDIYDKLRFKQWGEKHCFV